jgi:hypothetical protein
MKCNANYQNIIKLLRLYTSYIINYYLGRTVRKLLGVYSIDRINNTHVIIKAYV